VAAVDVTFFNWLSIFILGCRTDECDCNSNSIYSIGEIERYRWCHIMLRTVFQSQIDSILNSAFIHKNSIAGYFELR